MDRRRSSLHPPLRARRGGKVRVIGIARISTDHQDEKSLADQKELLKRWLRQNTEGGFKLKMLSTRGSGERLDRRELIRLKRLIEADRADLIAAEDLGRICRRIDAFKICEMCEDHDTRLIALNDNVDTAQESWRMASFFAAMRHEQYNADTAKRIRRSLRNRFSQGGVVMTLTYGYIKPPGAKNDNEIQKLPGADAVIEGIFERLENDWSYSEVADWLNEQGVEPGKWCRVKRWDCAKVGRLVFNPILKGYRLRNKKMSRRVNKTGRRKSVNAPQEELLLRHVPHLVYIEESRYDRLIKKLQAKNAKYSVAKKNAIDPRLGRPKKRTVWPGQHVTCGICGYGYVYGGHGRQKYLMCSGAREYKCWNGATFESTAAAQKLASAVAQAIVELPEFEEDFGRMVEEATAEHGNNHQQCRVELADDLAQCQRKIANLTRAIEESGGIQALYAQLRELETKEAELQARLAELAESHQASAPLPSMSELRQLALASFANLSRESHVFAKAMKRLIPTIVVYPYRSIDGGSVVLRAKFQLSLVRLTPALRKLPLVPTAVTREVAVNLYEEPQRIHFREQVVRLIEQGMFQRETGETFGITQAAVQHALKLHALMQEAGVTDPYLPLTEPPDDLKKLRRHKHPRYRFSPKPPVND